MKCATSITRNAFQSTRDANEDGGTRVGLLERHQGASYSFEQVFKESELRDVVGFSSDFKVKARVANREMLIALKTNSMRLADQRDIAALCNSDVDVDKIVQLLKRCPQTIIFKNIDALFQTLGSPSYRDSIKGVFMLSDRVFERVTEQAEKVFKNVEDRLQE